MRLQLGLQTGRRAKAPQATVAFAKPHAGQKGQSSTSNRTHCHCSRRQAVTEVAAAAFVSLLGQQQAALAKPALLDLPSCKQFKQAGTIQYCDLEKGSGDSPVPGDLIVVDYTARAVATGEVYDGSRNFKFTVGNGEVTPGWEVGILGDDNVPAIKEGGSRTILVPPELAYGKEGDGCLFGLSDSCRIPPNSPVEITFKYKGLGY
eukprot:GHRR01012900.1.p1 GENE.GHRR01012900.1~~GHRR01012900.1.p1  ORF type:complete len:205 (+),score=42.45 GHRR01012900.1:177-791(+)